MTSIPEATRPEREPRPRSARRRARGKRTVLVVDDEKDITELISYNLTRHGYEVLNAFDGMEALEVAQRETPDLVLLDLMLPGLEGTEVARRLKADGRTSGIPIIMLTAKAEETDVVVGLTLGADDYITKPFSPKILLAAGEHGPPPQRAHAAGASGAAGVGGAAHGRAADDRHRPSTRCASRTSR